MMMTGRLAYRGVAAPEEEGCPDARNVGAAKLGTKAEGTAAHADGTDSERQEGPRQDAGQTSEGGS